MLEARDCVLPSDRQLMSVMVSCSGWLFGNQRVLTLTFKIPRGLQKAAGLSAQSGLYCICTAAKTRSMLRRHDIWNWNLAAKNLSCTTSMEQLSNPLHMYFMLHLAACMCSFEKHAGSFHGKPYVRKCPQKVLGSQTHLSVRCRSCESAGPQLQYCAKLTLHLPTVTGLCDCCLSMDCTLK